METAVEFSGTILIVDDDPVNLRLIQGVLKDKYKIYPATSGEMALKFLMRRIPDLILLDVEMPGLSGYDVLRRLKGEPAWKSIPVIILTGQDSRHKEETALDMGAIDYILKPIVAGILLKRVQIHIELKAYRKNMESLVSQKTSQLQKTQDAILDILAHITAFRDNETGGHIRRTTIYTKMLTDNLLKIKHPDYLFDEYYARDIVNSAKLHDIGKVAISDGILLKPSRLTPSEFEFIKLHTTFGAQMIDYANKDLGEEAGFLQLAKEIVLCHHEWWNGNGYPLRLKGTSIPLSARIMAISDVYDALISQRPYKQPYTHEESLEIIRSEVGTHFDPVLISLSEEVIKKFNEVVYEYQDEAFPMEYYPETYHI